MPLRRRSLLAVLVLPAVLWAAPARAQDALEPPAVGEAATGDWAYLATLDDWAREHQVVRLTGARRLLIGDSMCGIWPRPDYDAVGLWAQPSTVIRPLAARVLREYHHDEIIFWIGTAHLLAEEDRGVLQRDLAALVKLVGDRPYAIVGALVPRGTKPRVVEEYRAFNAHLAATYPYTIDPHRVLGIPGHGERYLIDTVHLSPPGYVLIEQALEPVLARAEADVRTAASAKRDVRSAAPPAPTGAE